MSYSSDEIDAGVSQIVQGAPTYSRDGLGARNVKERFSEVRELVDSVLLYEPDSVFYLIYKATIKARSLLNSVLGIMDDLSDDLDGMAVPAKAVKDTTALSDASAALSAISSALARRGSISSAEYKRYERAADRALSVYADSAKRTYTPFSGTQAVTDVVRSSAEAASDLQTNFNTFKSSYSTLLTTIDGVLAGYSDYDHDAVVSSVASRQMSRIMSEMEALETYFHENTPYQRAETARADTLSLLTNKASVKALALTRRPGDPKLEQASTGSSVYRLSAYGTGTAPTIEGAVSGPWPITNSSELEVDFGGTTVTVPLVPSSTTSVPGVKAAVVTGYAYESSGVAFAINEDVATPWPMITRNIATGTSFAVQNEWLYLVVDGVLYKVTDDTTGPPYSAFSADRTAAQLAGDIAFHVPTVNATAHSSGGYDWVSIEYNNSSPPAVYKNRYIQYATGPDHASTFTGGTGWRVDVGGDGSKSGTPTAAEVTRGWDGNDELWIWPNAVLEVSARKINLPNGSWPDYVVTAASVASAISGGASGAFTASGSGGNIVITSTVVGEGSILKIISEGLISNEKTPSMRGSDTLGFYLGQDVREENVRAQAIIDVLSANSDFIAQADVELVREELYSAKRARGNISNWDQVIVELDEDPSAGWTSSELKLSILSGENRGTYSLSDISYSTGYLRFDVDRNLRDPSESGFRISLFKEHVKITSKSNDTSAYIEVQDSGGNSAHDILGLSTSRVYGTVEQIWIEYNDPAKGWVSANLNGLGIKVGDVVLTEDRAIAAVVSGIDSISSGIIDVTPVLPTFSLSAFSIESVSFDNHQAFMTTLQDWRDGLSTNEEGLVDLENTVNVLLKLKNPVRGRVESAATELQNIRDLLEGSSALSGILSDFSQPAIPAVDRALDVMTENGHDRARDLLTSAQFSQYNSTNYKTASKSGAMMDAASKVATSDLVEPTKVHGEFTGEIDKIRSYSYADVDPEYDFGDARADSAPVYLDYFATDIPRSE